MSMNPTPPAINAPERREAVARAIYDVKPIRVTNRVEPLSFDEAASDGCWSEPEMSYKRADAILALLDASSGERGAETGWLIEESFGNGTHWIALSGGPQNWTKLAELDDHELFKADTPFRRTKDSNEALRFARKEDAEALIAKFDIHLWHAVATEHMWIPTPATVEEPKV